ncbi:MAG: UbiD family decarboxylase [Firmicutes bacterium]|nr:UbiD family decarboxylase [Bacillota bacterium]
MAKDLRYFLEKVKNELPDDYIEVTRSVDPNNFDITAILEHLTKQNKFPLVLFKNPKNLKGEDTEIPVVSNVFAKRERCALALDWPVDQSNLPLSLEYARLEREIIPPVEIGKEQAPVKEIILRGPEADPAILPGVRHYEMDLSPVFTMTLIMKDPDTGIYDITFAKTFYKGSQRMGASIHTPHLERIVNKYKERNEPAPVVQVLGHHPAFYLGSLALSPYDADDYASVGSFLREPLRLVESETWGKDFLVPADAEIIIEGEVLPGEKEIVDPFGEVTRHYQAQCIRQAVNVTAITRRKNAIMQDIFSGHEGHWNLGALPKEGSVFNAVNSRYGNVKAVHLPHSGIGRLACYISIDKKREGDAKIAGLAALLESWTFQVVVVVDDDIDVFNEKEVVWAILTMVDPKRDITMVENVHTVFTTAMGHNKMIIDATKPLDRAFPERFRIPESAMQRIKLDEWIK